MGEVEGSRIWGDSEHHAREDPSGGVAQAEVGHEGDQSRLCMQWTERIKTHTEQRSGGESTVRWDPPKRASPTFGVNLRAELFGDGALHRKIRRHMHHSVDRGNAALKRNQQLVGWINR